MTSTKWINAEGDERQLHELTRADLKSGRWAEVRGKEAPRRWTWNYLKTLMRMVRPDREPASTPADHARLARAADKRARKAAKRLSAPPEPDHVK